MKKLLISALALAISSPIFAHHTDCNVTDASTCIASPGEDATMTFQGNKDNKNQQMICEYQAGPGDAGSANLKFTLPEKGYALPGTIQIVKYYENEIQVNLIINDPTAFICKKCQYSCQTWINNTCSGEESNECPLPPFPCMYRGGLDRINAPFKISKINGASNTGIKITCHV